VRHEDVPNSDARENPIGEALEIAIVIDDLRADDGHVFARVRPRHALSVALVPTDFLIQVVDFLLGGVGLACRARERSSHEAGESHPAPRGRNLRVPDYIRRNAAQVDRPLPGCLAHHDNPDNMCCQSRQPDAPAARAETLIAETVDELASISSGRVLRHVRCSEGMCLADGGRLAQLVGNLVSNALAYGAPEVPVTVTSTIAAATCSIAVHNGGSPIPEHARARLFEPMTRGSDTTTGHRSVGLGLYIVREIAKAHGGQTRVASSAQEGTTFTVEFPRVVKTP
jgi:hypothetical protein